MNHLNLFTKFLTCLSLFFLKNKKLMGRTLSAQEMVEANMVARIYPAEGFRETVLKLAEDAAKFSAEALATTKKLSRDAERETLLNVNNAEMAALAIRTTSKDSIETVRRFAGKLKYLVSGNSLCI